MKGIKAASIAALAFSFASSAMTNYVAYLSDVLESEEHRYALAACAKAHDYSYRREAEEYSGSGSLGAGIMPELYAEAPAVALGPPGDSASEGGASFRNFIVKSWENGLEDIFNGF